MLVVEHDMGFVRRFAQTVTVPDQGKVLSEGTMDMVQQDLQVIRAYLGRSQGDFQQDAPAAHEAVTGRTATKGPSD